MVYEQELVRGKNRTGNARKREKKVWSMPVDNLGENLGIKVVEAFMTWKIKLNDTEVWKAEV